MSVNIKLGSNNITLEDEKLSFESATSAGTYVDFLYESGNKDVADLTEQDVSTKATARISAAERAKIIPGNIKEGVTFLGVTGTHAGGQNYSITGAITNGSKTGAQSIVPGQGANLIAKATIVPSTGYYLPVNVSVSNAQSTYDASTGEVSMHTPTANIVITATCPDTPPLAKGDVFLTPYNSGASTSDQSTWSKMLILEKSGNLLSVVPLTQSYYDNYTSTTMAGCPQLIECNTFMQNSYDGPFYYNSDWNFISQPYNILSGQAISMDWGNFHQSFSTAMQSTYTSIQQYVYDRGYDSSLHSFPDISSGYVFESYTGYPQYTQARMFDIMDLVNFYGSTQTGLSESTLSTFFFKNAHIDTSSSWENSYQIWTPSLYREQSEYVSNTYMWSIYSPSYSSMEGNIYDASWGYNSYYVDPSYSHNHLGFVPVISLDLSQLQYWARTNENWLNP